MTPAYGDLDLVAATSRFTAIERVHLAAALAEVLSPLAELSVPSHEVELKELDGARWTELRSRARPPGREDAFTERPRSERRSRHVATLRTARRLLSVGRGGAVRQPTVPLLVCAMTGGEVA